jgi:hypothetical protein
LSLGILGKPGFIIKSCQIALAFSKVSFTTFVLTTVPSSGSPVLFLTPFSLAVSDVILIVLVPLGVLTSNPLAVFLYLRFLSCKAFSYLRYRFLTSSLIFKISLKDSCSKR